MAKAACDVQAEQIVVTGAATSVIGPQPLLNCYKDPLQWANPKLVSRPNERAKIVAEKIIWNEVLHNQLGGSRTKINSLLPYFISGPPLYK